MRSFIQQGIEKYCPVCDANDIYTPLERNNKNGEATVTCCKCGYVRTYSKDEVLNAEEISA